MRAIDALAQADRRRAARGRGSQPAVPGNPHLQERPGDRAAADERGRRARPLRAGLRQGRGDDAVQHVSPLHGGRAPVALHRRAGGDRARRQPRDAARQRSDPQAAARQPHGALRRAVPARHRQGPHRGPFDRRRAGGAAVLPAAGLFGGRHRDGRLADRKPSGDVERGAVARSVRPQDHREFRRGGAVGRTAEAA